MVLQSIKMHLIEINVHALWKSAVYVLCSMTCRNMIEVCLMHFHFVQLSLLHTNARSNTRLVVLSFLFFTFIRSALFLQSLKFFKCFETEEHNTKKLMKRSDLRALFNSN